MREIKFRAWDGANMHSVMGAVFNVDSIQHSTVLVNGIPMLLRDNIAYMQYTGLKDKNGKEIYEGDIFRIEEDTDAGTEFIYVVITWVQEWCMFCTLRVEDEYPGYLNNGLKELDEPLFWTYTLEDTNSRKHFLCGNVYENPELL